MIIILWKPIIPFANSQESNGSKSYKGNYGNAIEQAFGNKRTRKIQDLPLLYKLKKRSKLPKDNETIFHEEVHAKIKRSKKKKMKEQTFGNMWTRNIQGAMKSSERR